MAITHSQADQLQHVALMRLTLRLMGETHRLFAGFQSWLTGQIGSQGLVDPVKMAGLIQRVEGEWRATVQRWVDLFALAREQAASLPFGALVVKHNHYMNQLQESMSPEDIGAITRLWQQRRERALAATRDRIYGDGLNLSQRIWRLENEGLTQIRSTLATAMAGRTNAIDLARQLEAQLGADQEMPRWTRDRLYKLTAREKETDRTALLTSTEHRSRGIAYNALRLARTELQFANHAVTTEIAKHSPWVTGRQVRLSPAHPKIDICDTYAAGGPYPVDQEILPLHPNCLCYYEEVLLSADAFARQVKGWLAGENSFLDEYQRWLGARTVTEPLPWNMSLADSLELWLSTNQGAHAAALRLEGASPLALGAPQVIGPSVAPAQPGPKGTVVSGALTIPAKGKYASRYQNALRAIDSVHGDGALPAIPVETKSATKALGEYAFYPGGQVKGIAIRGSGDHFELTLAHEVGHFLDHMGIGRQGQFATRAEPGLMTAWQTAVARSRAVQSLQEKRANPTAYMTEVTIQRGGRAATFQATPSTRHLDYLLRQDELWARSYAQYVALRSRNAALLEQVANERSDRLYGDRQWADDDFEPIAQAIDQLFGGLGWRQ